MNVENKNFQECNANLVNSACDCAVNKKAYIRPHTQIIDFEDIVVCSGGCTTACFEELVDTSNNGTANDCSAVTCTPQDVRGDSEQY